MRKNKMPISWLFWHPHQGLWNWALVDGLRVVIPIAPIHRMICHCIILLDTLVLFLRALATRVRLLGMSNIFRQARVADGVSILYLDAGTHTDASELLLVVSEILPAVCKHFEAYGFEANQQSFEQVAEKLADRDNVRILHKALVHHVPSNGKIRLYKDSGSGLADSIYRRTSQSEEVECLRLSEFLIGNGLIQDNRIVLLRMNIEGAEFDVLQDLVENGLDQRIDGYFGMWDDVSKIDIGRDAEFRVFLAQHRIRTFPFNGRDLSWSFRRKCIAYHMHTRIMKRLRELQEV